MDLVLNLTTYIKLLMPLLISNLKKKRKSINDFRMKYNVFLPIMSILFASYEIIRCNRKGNVPNKYLILWVNITALCMALLSIVTLSLMGICVLMMGLQNLLVTIRHRCDGSIFALNGPAASERGGYMLSIGLFVAGVMLLIQGY